MAKGLMDSGTKTIVVLKDPYGKFNAVMGDLYGIKGRYGGNDIDSIVMLKNCSSFNLYLEKQYIIDKESVQLSHVGIPSSNILLIIEDQELINLILINLIQDQPKESKEE